MNITKALFSHQLVNSLATSFSEFNLLDLRTRGEFSFYSPGGLTVLTLYCWLISENSGAGLLGTCEISNSIVDVATCSGVWVAVGIIFTVCTLAVFGLRQLSKIFSASTFVNNIIMTFVFSGGMLALIKLKIGEAKTVYDALSDIMAGSGFVANLIDPSIAALCSTIVFTVLLYLSIKRLPTKNNQRRLKTTRSDVSVLLMYWLVTTTLTCSIFGY